MDNFPPGVHVSTTVSTGATASSLATSQSNGSCRTGPGTGLRAALNSKGHINNEPGLFTYRWWGILAWSHSSSAGQRKTRISGGTDFHTTPESFQLNVFFPFSLFNSNLSFYLSPFYGFLFFPPSPSTGRDQVPASVVFISPLPEEGDRGEPCLFLFGLTDFLCAVNRTPFNKPPAQRRREEEN